MKDSIYTLNATQINGKELELKAFEGQVLLIVNTASQCGFTPQYQGLETLYKKFKEQGFSVLAFPCNQFGSQEPGNEEQISSFCSTKFSVSFPLFAKIDVNGNQTHPLYTYLKSHAPGVLGSKSIKWNFTKFLVNKSGKAIKRYSPATLPENIYKDIETELAK